MSSFAAGTILSPMFCPATKCPETSADTGRNLVDNVIKALKTSPLRTGQIIILTNFTLKSRQKEPLAYLPVQDKIICGGGGPTAQSSARRCPYSLETGK